MRQGGGPTPDNGPAGAGRDGCDRVSLAEASVKVRSGPPSDDADDIAAGGRWAGVVPVRSSFGTPESGPAMPEPVPDHVTDRERPTPGQRSAE